MKIAKSVTGRPRDANVPLTSLDSSEDFSAFVGAAESGVNDVDPPAADASGLAAGAVAGAPVNLLTSIVAVA